MSNRIFLLTLIPFTFFVMTACQPNHWSESSDKPAITQKARTLNEAARLRKISLHLRGFGPTSSEYAELRTAMINLEGSKFLKTKLHEYLNSAEHIEKMNLRLNELFRLRSDSSMPGWPTPPAYDFNRDDQADFSQYKLNNSFNHLVRQIISGNRPWDELLTKTQYRLFNLKRLEEFPLEAIDDINFVRSLVDGPLPPAKIDPKDRLKYPEHVDVDLAKHPQAAGILSTSRFFARNPTTAVNKNRKRAASVFRTLLCDDMAAVAVDQKGNTEPIFRLIFPESKMGKGTVATADDMHGSDPACMKCHYKLDPLGQVFAGSVFTLSSEPSLGALVYSNKSNRLINIPVKGFRELAEAIRTQPEYLDCQVQHFWNWFIGEDIKLTEPRRQELVQNFESQQRRVNDFIAYLLESPEFTMAEVADTSSLVQLGQVKQILQRCDSCHRQEAAGLPKMAEFPIGGSSESMMRVIQKMASVLDLAGDGSKASMPPRNSDMKLSKEERDLLKTWIFQGAPYQESL